MFKSLNLNTETRKQKFQFVVQKKYFYKMQILKKQGSLKDFVQVKRQMFCWVVVAHAFNPSIQEAEAGGSLWVPAWSAV